MKYASLRQTDQLTVDAYAALALWPQRDAALAQRLALAPLPCSATLVAVDAYRQGLCWSGFLDLNEWLASTSPALAALAFGASPADRLTQMRRLFEAGDRPVHFPLPELAYDSLRVRPCQEQACDGRCRLTVATPQGRVWLTSFPLEAIPGRRLLSAPARALPLRLELRLGSSSVRRGLLAGLRRGDVLLIGREAFELASAGKTIGRFSINEEGKISMQEANTHQHDSHAEVLQESVTASETAAATESATELVTESIAASLNHIPVRLDFVLQRCVMTVAELDSLYQGQMLMLDPQAEKQVEITVNGVRLARGELVELNGRLGVELHELAIGKKPAEG